MATVYYTQKIDLCQRWLCPSLVQISRTTTPNAQDKSLQRKKLINKKNAMLNYFLCFFIIFKLTNNRI